MAAITGLPLEQIEAAVVAHRVTTPEPKGKRRKKLGVAVQWMWSSEIEPVMAALGYRAELTSIYGRACGPTLARWLLRRDRTAPHVVLITGHFIAVQGDHYVDTGAREPRLLRCCIWRRKRVQWAWRVTKIV